MTDRKDTEGGRDYEVGYGKPPSAIPVRPWTIRVQAVSQRRRRRRKQAEIIARVRDQTMSVQGREMTLFEISVKAVLNQTIKSGKARDLR
jgi:hypothetical protein